MKLRDNLTSGRNFADSNKPTEVPTCSKNTECPPSGKRSPELTKSFAQSSSGSSGELDRCEPIDGSHLEKQEQEVEQILDSEAILKLNEHIK